MAKCTAHRKGDNISDSVSISFTKDSETGFYRKIEKNIRSNYKEHKTKSIGKPKPSEEFYRLSNSENFDYKYEVSSPKGELVTIYFKRVAESVDSSS